MATLLEAERYHSSQALVVIHALEGADRSFRDFQAFVDALRLGPVEKDSLSQSKTLGGVTLRLGWASA